MAVKRDVPYLKPVPPRVSNPIQRQLFPETPPAEIALVDMSSISASEFQSVVTSGCSAWMFDLRAAPRFDLEWLNRRTAFELFRQHDVRYHDVAGILELRSSDASLSAGIVGRCLSEIMSASGPGPWRVLVLVDDPVSLTQSERLLPDQLKPEPKGGWSVRTYGTVVEKHRV